MDAEFEKDLIKMVDLVESGKLPDGAIPRVFYFGHEVVGSIRKELRQFKCVDCDHCWSFKEDHETEVIIFADHTCPKCKTADNVYDITGDSQIADWKCRACSHRWRGENGHVCPECGAESK